MKRLLITGFDAFGGQTINPSWEAVKNLPDTIGNFSLTKLQIPTVFDKASEKVINKAKEIDADVIICIGQAGGRASITPEVVAINLKEASIPDNEGNQPKNVAIKENSPTAYFSTLPVREIVSKVSENNIPCALSFSAGAFVCNEVLYSLLHRFDGTKVKVGFIHVPFLPEQAENKHPSLPLETIVKALETAISSIN